MRLYIASSWRNEARVLRLAEVLRGAGHEVDAFCDKSSGRYSFRLDELRLTSNLAPNGLLSHPMVLRAFVEDRRKLDWSEGVILMLPAGASSHLEGGYAVGQGKALYILEPPGGFEHIGEVELMYGLATGVFSEHALLKELRAGKE